jgi:hypothetical protein
MRQMQVDYEKEITEAILVTTRQTSYGAKMNAPVDKGRLRNSIRPFNKGMTGEVVVGASYGPYQEYGTGTKVRVPSELSSYAMQFKGAGIRQVNLRPQPYFYPAFFINRDRFMKDMDRRIDKIANKHWR